MVARIEYELAGLDLAEVRFVVSPLNELTLSLRTWRDPGRYPVHLPWLRHTQPARGRLDRTLLLSLVSPELRTPDFLTPRPTGPLTRIEDELAAVARTPASVVREDLAEVHPDGLPSVLDGSAAAVRSRIVAVLTSYWETCFAPWWPRMRSILEADVVHRGRTMSRRGTAAMFADLSDRVAFADGTVTVRLSNPLYYRRSTAGEGLTLVPSLFTRGASVPVSAEEPPLIMYGARGVGTLWEAGRADEPAAALAAVLGEVRAGLLTTLATPASTTELAGRLGVTPSAVSQHLRALRDAGLLSAARAGRSVLYLRSELGDDLVGGGRGAVTPRGTNEA
ncbi:helix-turn-helix protein [Mumia flava]|uniref:Helix-turn-helix protein n=1 Tax=Mumia flava TaxID=1348852 RepID=A0A0B2B808_9ACTN|nr:DUF5937 family protein [Mumia flava]PJJ56769.1 helix-turn-helix protein [Mumia flava]